MTFRGTPVDASQYIDWETLTPFSHTATQRGRTMINNYNILCCCDKYCKIFLW